MHKKYTYYSYTTFRGSTTYIDCYVHTCSKLPTSSTLQFYASRLGTSYTDEYKLQCTNIYYIVHLLVVAYNLKFYDHRSVK